MMRLHHRTCRLTSTVAVAALMMGTLPQAYAQQAPAPPDPPARVGGVARLEGTVSFHTFDEDHWEPATLNYPVTSGNAFWTQPAAGADVDIGRTRMTLDQSTEFSVDTLDDARLVATVGQGRVYVRISAMAAGESEAVRTPRGTVTFSQPGRYEITVGTTSAPTLVTVDEGAAQISGPGFAVSVGAHQTASISGIDSFTASVIAESPDGFLTAQIAREQPIHAEGPATPPSQVLQMTGYEAVAETGQWADAPDYGRVWYPPVNHDWVPYRQGHWSWVAPWGWTWVDDASWGFAPFHYGRWVEIRDRWAWTPVDRGYAEDARPVYAPALVTFVGVAAGIGIAGAVGWIPLGPREVYRPPYRASDTYIRRVNVGNVTNITTMQSNNRYINQGAATVVPATAMQRSQGVASLARPIPAAEQASFQPIARPLVQPTFATRGVTPVVARSMNLQPQPGVPAPLRVGPGPVFRTPATLGATALPQPAARGPAQQPRPLPPSFPQAQAGHPPPAAMTRQGALMPEDSSKPENLRREVRPPSSQAQPLRTVPPSQATRPAQLEPVRPIPLPQIQRPAVPHLAKPNPAPQEPRPIPTPQRAAPAAPHFLPPSTPQPLSHHAVGPSPAAAHRACPAGHATC